jgi:hypothetical protein
MEAEKAVSSSGGTAEHATPQALLGNTYPTVLRHYHDNIAKDVFVAVRSELGSSRTLLADSRRVLTTRGPERTANRRPGRTGQANGAPAKRPRTPIESQRGSDADAFPFRLRIASR